MKNLIFINGTMGVGKTATCMQLKQILPQCAFLDGDWCWDMDPFIVTDETKAMVEKNIQYIINSFIRCSEYENIVFCWVMHKESIINELLIGIDLDNINLHKFSIMCKEDILAQRLRNDVHKGLRSKEIINRSLERVKNYMSMDTIKINVSYISEEAAAKEIKKHIIK